MLNVETGTLISQFRTLIVEDYKPFLYLVCSVFQGWANLEIVGTEQDGLAAVERTADLQPDLILFDVGLPGLNGIDAAYRIRRLAPMQKSFLRQESCAEIVHDAELGRVEGTLLKLRLHGICRLHSMRSCTERSSSVKA